MKVTDLSNLKKKKRRVISKSEEESKSRESQTVAKAFRPKTLDLRLKAGGDLGKHLRNVMGQLKKQLVSSLPPLLV